MLAALVLIPSYIGFIHVNVVGAAAYAGVGAAAMAAGEDLQFGLRRPGFTFRDVALWSAFIAGLGAIAYFAALILI